MTKTTGERVDGTIELFPMQCKILKLSSDDISAKSPLSRKSLEAIDALAKIFVGAVTEKINSPPKLTGDYTHFLRVTAFLRLYPRVDGGKVKSPRVQASIH